MRCLTRGPELPRGAGVYCSVITVVGAINLGKGTAVFMRGTQDVGRLVEDRVRVLAAVWGVAYINPNAPILSSQPLK